MPVNQMEASLRVCLLDKKVRTWLDENDPMLVRQMIEAMGCDPADEGMVEHYSVNYVPVMMKVPPSQLKFERKRYFLVGSDGRVGPGEDMTEDEANRRNGTVSSRYEKWVQIEEPEGSFAVDVDAV